MLHNQILPAHFQSYIASYFHHKFQQQQHVFPKFLFLFLPKHKDSFPNLSKKPRPARYLLPVPAFHYPVQYKHADQAKVHPKHPALHKTDRMLTLSEKHLLKTFRTSYCYCCYLDFLYPQQYKFHAK